MFWPAFYVLLWVLVRAVFKQYPHKDAALILFVVVMVQAVDTSAGWLAYRPAMENVATTWPSPLKSPFWEEVPSTYREIRLVTPRNRAPNWDVFAYFCATHGMASDAWYGARLDESKLRAATQQALDAVNHRVYAEVAMYVLEPRYRRAAARSLRGDADFLGRVDGFLVLAPGWRCRPACLSAKAAENSECSSSCSNK